jgi:hypothetical protein
MVVFAALTSSSRSPWSSLGDFPVISLQTVFAAGPEGCSDYVCLCGVGLVDRDGAMDCCFH